MSEQQTKNLLEIAKRIDSYVNATNAKIGIVLSYSAAYLAGIALKSQDILKPGLPLTLRAILAGCAVISTFAALMATIRILQALEPRLDTGNDASEQRSLIFFDDIANRSGGRDSYVAAYRNSSDDLFATDLAQQVHTVAKIASTKFRSISNAIWWLKNVNAPFFLLLVLTLIAGTFI